MVSKTSRAQAPHARFLGNSHMLLKTASSTITIRGSVCNAKRLLKSLNVEFRMKWFYTNQIVIKPKEKVQSRVNYQN